MPKRISDTELDIVLKAVATFPSPLSLEQINKRMRVSLPRRTLQRRLALLVVQGKLETIGRGRATHYRIGMMAQKFAPKKLINLFADYPVASHDRSAAKLGRYMVAESSATFDLHIPISAEGNEVQKSIRLPMHLRNPVGYNRAFLEAYQPNKTFYLPIKTREYLYSIGHAPDGNYPAGTYAKQIFNRLLIDLSWNSSRLEGNSYSLLETEYLLQSGEPIEGKSFEETQMILNHKKAIEFFVDYAAELQFNRKIIFNLHACLSQDLLQSNASSGSIRKIPVGISGTVYHPLNIPQLLEEIFQQILDTANAINDPFEQSFFAMVHLPYLQPFEDVNKRVSRLSANLPLIRQNLSPLSFVDVPRDTYLEGTLGVYELNRVELLRDVYIWAYEQSCGRYSAVQKHIGEPNRFVFRHQRMIKETVRDVVQNKMNKETAAQFIKKRAQETMKSKEEVARLIEMIETDLLCLHEGNFVPFKLSESEYLTWKKIWGSSFQQ